MEKMMSRVHTWKASSPVKARLTSNSIFITFLGDTQLKTFSERIPSSASLAYPAPKAPQKYLLQKIPLSTISPSANLLLKDQKNPPASLTEKIPHLKKIPHGSQTTTPAAGLLPKYLLTNSEKHHLPKTPLSQQRTPLHILLQFGSFHGVLPPSHSGFSLCEPYLPTSNTLLVVVESRASLRSELYWPLVLPNTPKPKFCGFSSGLVIQSNKNVSELQLQLTLTTGDADLPSEVYWNSVLPNYKAFMSH
ncbi:hypothetical protein CK203_064630 [Vitis vinifera]|uniref:Uncharacterized protein n=1 Tax=Vitis vinifera TaxID=29760 RepID=A0A438FQ84_VITVI|nr:hypothetical protein CK203_064630 [Vitis vinifera]